MLPGNLTPATPPVSNGGSPTVAAGITSTDTTAEGLTAAAHSRPEGFDQMLSEFLRLQDGESGYPAGELELASGLSGDPELLSSEGQELPLAADPLLLSAAPDIAPAVAPPPVPLQLTELENGVLLSEQGQPNGAFLRARFESRLIPPATDVIAGRLSSTAEIPRQTALTATDFSLPASVLEARQAATDADSGDAFLAQFSPRERTPGSPAAFNAGLAPMSVLPVTGGAHGTTALPDIQTPVQHPAWAAQVNDRLQWMVKNNLQQADIQLDPPELGRLDVRVVVNHDQTHVSFSSGHAVVRDALEAALPRLREMFQEQGLNLANVDISHQSFGHEREPAEQSGGSGYAGAVEEDGAEPVATGSTMNAGLAGRGLLDVFA